MFSKKISKQELEEFRERTKLVKQYLFIANALETQKRFFLQDILPKYGCDMNKNYNINLDTGKIKEIKKQINNKE